MERGVEYRKTSGFRIKILSSILGRQLEIWLDFG